VKVVLIALALAATACASPREDRARRLDRECGYVRLVLESARTDLWSDDHEKRFFGFGTVFKAEQNDWHEFRVCAPEDISVGDDYCGELVDLHRACVLHELDWALAWIR
jgi:hypothetical protein